MPILADQIPVGLEEICSHNCFNANECNFDYAIIDLITALANLWIFRRTGRTIRGQNDRNEINQMNIHAELSE